MKVWILFGILACIAWQANSAALDDYQDALDEEDLNHLMKYIEAGTESRMEKRGRKFCLRRDMTCPNVEGKRDFCCKGSQCACNIFGQNCRYVKSQKCRIISDFFEIINYTIN